MMKKAYYADNIYFDSKLLQKAWLLVDGDVILDCVYEKPEGYSCYSFDNSAIFPTFINTHTHAPMTLLRGYADDLPLHTWLNEHIWPAEKRFLSYDFVKDASMMAAAELIHGGTSCISDMYFFPEAEIEAFSAAGIRSVIGATVMSAKSHGKLFGKVEDLLAKVEDNPLTRISIAPHAIYTASPDVYKLAVEICHKYDLLLHTHLSESQQELDNSIKEYGKSPVQIMNEVGAFDCKAVFAHCVHLTNEDIALMGKKNVNVSHCLQSNLKLASGLSPVTSLMKAGANVSIGTDGASSNNDQDMLSEMQTTALVHKALSNDPTAISAETVLNMATNNGAKAIAWDNIGQLKAGYQADFMVVSYESVHMQPLFNPLSNLVYSGQQRDITDVFVAGRQLMKNRELTTIDEKELIAKAKLWTEKIAVY